MIRAKHHSIIYPLFKCLVRFLLKRNFTSTNIEGEYCDNGSSVLVVANHISWWDGFWVEYLNQKVIHRKLHFMMLEDQLKKHWYFQHTGGYSVKKNSREVVESINYTVELLKKNNNLVLMFPQGIIHSSYIRSVHFESGIQHILNQCADDTQVVLVANFTDYLSDAKPNLYIYLKTFTTASLRNSNIEEAYNQFFAGVLDRHNIKTS